MNLKVKKVHKMPVQNIIVTAMNASQHIEGLAEMKFDSILQEASTTELRNMLQFLEHDKTTNQKKLEMLGDHTSQLSAIIQVRDFLDSIILKAHDMIHDAVLIGTADDKGGINMKKIVSVVRVGLARAEEKEQAAQAAAAAAANLAVLAAATEAMDDL